MNVLITGAGGFLGRYIARQLLAQGHKVFNFSRSKHPILDELGVISIQGDITKYQEVESAFSDMDAIVHTASKIGMAGKWDDYFQTNVTGTTNVIAACTFHKIAKLIYTSTPSVVFGKDDLEGVDESRPYPEVHLNHYAKSKAMAEQLVLDANNSNTLCTVALRPHLIFGPDDPHIIPKILEASQKKKLKIVGDGENLVDVIFVENAAKAHVNALKTLDTGTKICGNAYFLGQEKPVNLWNFINEILKLHGFAPITKKVNANLAYSIGAIFEFIFFLFRITSIDPPMTRFTSLQFSKSHYFDLGASIADLGSYQDVSTQEALARSKSTHTAR